MKLRLLFCFVLCASHIQAAHVIIIMGPSCAGKSTISEQLCAAHLNVKNEIWRRIDLDEYRESIDLLIKAANRYLLKKVNVVIDTNTYKKDMEKEFVGASVVTKILVTAPLEVLLERDAQRTKNIQRTAQRAARCRDFVIKSFHESSVWPVDLRVDTSARSVQELCENIFKFLKK